MKKKEPKSIGNIMSEDVVLQPLMLNQSNEDVSMQILKSEISKREREYWNKVHNPPLPIENAEVIYSVEQILDVIQQRGDIFLNKDGKGNKFIIDESNIKTIQILIYYFLKDAEFEKIKPGYSLKKGILIRSANKGTGKTMLMKLFSGSSLWKDQIRFASYPLFKVIACRKIVSEYRKKGELIYDQYCEKILNVANQNIWVFDELGREDQTVNSFGNKSNVMEKILADRYDLYVDYGIRTHITTNIVDGGDIERLYGDYLRSRFREMFNVIDLEGNDRRI